MTDILMGGAVTHELIKQHETLLDSFAGKVLVRTSPGFHTKYLIIDLYSENSSDVK
jgi:hypothetical protein